MKTCTQCAQSKENSEFYNRKVECKDCSRARARAYGATDKSKNAALLKRYGVTLAAFRERLLSQGGKCATCERTDGLMLDHCHTTGVFRGVLCRRCNLAVGLLNDSAETAAALSTYLGK